MVCPYCGYVLGVCKYGHTGRICILCGSLTQYGKCPHGHSGGKCCYCGSYLSYEKCPHKHPQMPLVEWRPWTHFMFSPRTRLIMRTLLLLAKIQ